MFFRRRVSGRRGAFARRSVSNQSSGLRLDRDANDYRPGDGDPVGTPLGLPPKSAENTRPLPLALPSSPVRQRWHQCALAIRTSGAVRDCCMNIGAARRWTLTYDSTKILLSELLATRHCWRLDEVRPHPHSVVASIGAARGNSGGSTRLLA